MRRRFASGAAGFCRAVGIGLLGAVLAGCVGTTTAPLGLDLGDYRADPRELIGVSRYAAAHPVRVAGGGAIAAKDRDELAAFIAGVAQHRPESLRIMLRGRATPAQLGAVRTVLLAEGVPPEHIYSAPHRHGRAAVPGGGIVVEVERAIAIAPNCPGMMGHPTAPEDNLFEPNFGCANVYNLAAMVADPHHLVRGASSIYYEGVRGAADVTAYREDKVKELPRPGAFTATQ